MSLLVDIALGLAFGFPASPVTETEINALSMVERDAWLRFANLFLHRENAVTDHFRYGLFGFSVRRLCDLGVMTNPYTTHRGDRLIWLATWVPPLTLETFLTDAAKQYELFVRSMEEYANDSIIIDLVGRRVDNATVTLSGLLAVCHKAGVNGLVSWFDNPAERLEFSHTTQHFNRANGIF